MSFNICSTLFLQKCERLTLLILSNILSTPFQEPVSPLVSDRFSLFFSFTVFAEAAFHIRKHASITTAFLMVREALMHTADSFRELHIHI